MCSLPAGPPCASDHCSPQVPSVGAPLPSNPGAGKQLPARFRKRSAPGLRLRPLTAFGGLRLRLGRWQSCSPMETTGPQSQKLIGPNCTGGFKVKSAPRTTQTTSVSPRTRCGERCARGKPLRRPCLGTDGFWTLLVLPAVRPAAQGHSAGPSSWRCAAMLLRAALPAKPQPRVAQSGFER